MHELNSAKTHAIQNQIGQMGYSNPVFATEASVMMSSLDTGYIDHEETDAVAIEIEARSIHLNLTGTDEPNGVTIAATSNSGGLMVGAAAPGNGANEDQDMAAIRRARFARNQSTLVSQEVDLLICDNIFTIKTRTYLNIKKSLQMLKPVGVLVVLILILIFLFRVDSFVSSSSPTNPDESI